MELTFGYNAALIEALRLIPGAYYAEKELGRKGVWRYPAELTGALKLIAAEHGYDIVGLGDV